MKSIINNVGRHIIRLSRDRKILKLIADAGAKIIQIRTSQGFGVDQDEGSKKELRKLKASTIKQRKRYKDRLASGVGPDKSRLTFTGQMIDSIKGKVASNKAIVYLKGKHKNTSLSNEELAAIHEDTGRKFMHFSNKEIEVIRGIARREIKNALKKLF